jgi:hypothetical protein
MTAKHWTPDELEIVRKLAAEGKSASEIGHQVGRTRNSVIGVMHRNKVKSLAKSGAKATKENSPNPPRPRRGEHLRRVFLTGPKQERVKHEISPPPPPSKEHYVPFLKRQNYQCKVIVEKRGEQHICCGTPATRNGWCDYHASIVYRPFDEQPKYRDGGSGKHKKIHGPSG